MPNFTMREWSLPCPYKVIWDQTRSLCGQNPETADTAKVRCRHQTIRAQRQWRPTPAMHHDDRGAGGMCHNERPPGPVSRNNLSNWSDWKPCCLFHSFYRNVSRSSRFRKTALRVTSISSCELGSTTTPKTIYTLSPYLYLGNKSFTPMNMLKHPRASEKLFFRRKSLTVP